MITNQEEITKYTNENKIYIPTQYKNQNYTYKINGDYITIITNNNCQTNYNTTYCTCYYYNYKNNLMSDSYSCSTNNNNPSISYSLISNDINDSIYIRNRYIEDKSIMFFIIGIGIIFAILLMKGRR